MTEPPSPTPNAAPELGQVLFLNANMLTDNKLNSTSYSDMNTNIGNAYITYSWLKILGLHPRQVVFYNNIWRPSPNHGLVIEASRKASWIFLNLQDQLRSTFKDEEYVIALDLLQKLDRNVKMVAFSLCANSFKGFDANLINELSPTRRRFFDFLAERCVSIGVRGLYTASIMVRMGIRNFGVVGCPSYFERGAGRHVETPEQRAGYSALGATGNAMISTLMDRHNYLQGDSGWPYINLLYGPDSIWKEETSRPDFWKNYNAPVLKSVLLERCHFFSNFDEWQKHIREHCQLVYGTRLHGAIMALNAGVPAVVTNIDARSKDTCSFLGIPHRPEFAGEIIDKNKLIEAANPITANALYETRRKNFLDWLHSIGLSAKDRTNMLALPNLEKVPHNVVTQRVRQILESHAAAQH